MGKVVCIGGGVVGLTSAYFLRKAGMDVTIIEKEAFGMACSRGNQGWIAPALHEPVPAPGLVSESFQMLMKKDSPLYIKPSAVPKLSGWLTEFMKHCNENAFKAGEKALLTLSKSTIPLYNQLEEDGVNFELHKEGMLFVFLNEDNLRKKMQRLEKAAEAYGHEKPSYLNAAEVKALEPAISDEVKGGIFVENQYHARPETLSEGLVEKLTEMGVSLYPNTEVINFNRQDNQITEAVTKNQTFEADYFLLSAGAWSEAIAKKIEYKLPMTAGKGYSITVNNPNIELTRPLYLGDLKAGITPFNQAVRIGGTMELSGNNLKMDKKRIDGIRSAAGQYVREKIQGESEQEWGGMRPMTPDGLPVLGKLPELTNMYAATGHGMIGLAMAPVSGKVIADLIYKGTTELEIDAFRPDRFEKTVT